MNKISIKYLEQRMDIDNEIFKLETIFSEKTVGQITSFPIKNITFNDLLRNYFDSFPLSGTSRDPYEFLEDRYIYPVQEDYNLYLLNLFSNFIFWLLEESGSLKSLRLEVKIISNLYNQILLILESQNYKNIVSEEKNEYGFLDVFTVKRDEDIDSVLEYISPDLRLDLLSYIDFRFEKNIKHKESIIARLYKDIESKKTTLNCDPFKSLYTDTKFALNIPRHHREYIMTDEEKILWYDRSFRMYVHLIRSQEIKKYQSELKKLGPLLNK